MSQLPGERELLPLLLAAGATFHKMRHLGRRVGAVSEEGGGVWGLMRSLALDGPQTVPQLARARPVTRQHIQTLVNGLLDDGLVRLIDNPRHKRSRLVALTAAGKRRYEKLDQAVLALTRRLAPAISAEECAAALRVLARINEALDRLIAADEP